MLAPGASEGVALRRVRSVSGIVTAVVVIVLTANFVSPAAAAPATSDAATTVEVPPLVSPPVVLPQSTIPAGNFSGLESSASTASSTPVTPSAPVVPGAVRGVGSTSSLQDTSKSTLETQTEFSNTYLNRDGTHTTAVGMLPLNARDSSGAWVPVTTRLTQQQDGNWETKAHPLTPVFAPRADENGAFAVSRGGYNISFTTDRAASSQLTRLSSPFGTSSSDTFLYRNVFNDVDLKYQVQQGGVKESLTLYKLPSAAESTWQWHISARGLSLSVDRNNVVNFTDSAGNVQFHIPAPIMSDSSGVAGQSGPAERNLATRVWRDGDRWVLSLSADYSWLKDRARVYPVIVDPTLGIGPSAYNAYKSDGAYRSDSVLVGNSRSNGDTLWRTVVRYDYPSMAGKQVTAAQVNIGYNGDGYTGAAAGGIYMANCFGFSCNGEYLSGYTVDSGSTWAGDAGLGNRFAQLVRDGQLATNLMYTGTESSSYTYKNVWANLYFNWKDFPSVTALKAPSPANGALRAPVMPTFDATGSDPGGTGLQWQYKVGTTSNVDASAVWTSTWSTTSQQQVPQGKLTVGGTYYWKAYVKDGYDGVYGTSTVRSSVVQSFTTNAPAPTADQSSSTPVDGSTQTTLTPALTTAPVVDINGDPVQYQFRIATGSDGKTGAVISSGWLSSPTWPVPPGTLQDGGSYSWVALTSDGIDTNFEPAWNNKLKINLRLGTTGPSPFDSAGPVTVNLANGNASLRFSSPTVNTVGGPMGLSFAYNSQQSPTLLRGLTGTYFNALATGQSSTTTFDITGKTPLLVRTDPAVSFQWGTASPAPSVPSDYFMARWTGFIQVPAAGSYTFGTSRDDGTRVWVNSTQVVNNWTTDAATKQWGSAIALSTTPVPFQFDYYDSTATAAAQLWVRTPTGAEFIVPPDWFSTRVQTLPNGWSSSTPIAGASSAYVSARVTEASVALTDVTGSVHTYTKPTTMTAAAGGYNPPAGEYGILSLDAAGLVVLTADDGTVYTFDAR